MYQTKLLEQQTYYENLLSQEKLKGEMKLSEQILAI